jgi:hypothetical protein
MSFHLNLVTREYHRVRPKWFLGRWYLWHKPRTLLASTVTLSPKERSEIPHDLRQLRVSSGVSKMIFKPMVHSTQTVHLSCVMISTISERTEHSLEPRHLGVPFGAFKMISEPIVRLAQTMHLSCIDTNTISYEKKRDSSWPMSPRSFIGCVQNDFLSLWYVRC